MDSNIKQKLKYLIAIGANLDEYIQGGEFKQIVIPDYITLADSLPIGYKNTQFIGCLMKLIIDVTKNQGRMITLQNYSKRLDFSFKQQFEKYKKQFDLKNVNEGDLTQEIDCAISIFESMFLKIFQQQMPKVYMDILNSTFIYWIQSGHKIQDNDLQLIKRIVNSNKVKPLIKELNTIRFKNNDQSDDHLNDEINQLLKVLSEPFFITKTRHYGLTCLDGKLIFRSQIVNYKKQGVEADKYRALLIITCIHEVFFHLKRIKFCDMNDVLQTTPPKYSVVQSEKQPTVGEAGNYFEYNNCSEELAEAILDPTKWEDDNFRFWSVKINDTPNKQQQYESPLLKQGFQDISPPYIQTTYFKCLTSFQDCQGEQIETKDTQQEAT